MGAIFKRELKTYFTSPIGWVYLAIFWYFSGDTFRQIVTANYAGVTPVFSVMQSMVMILIPILTMRMFSEEKKQKTDQLLFTAPVGLTGVVMGKLCAAYTVYLAGFSCTLVYGLILDSHGSISWSLFYSNFLGVLLLGLALIAIGAFVSALTESQAVAFFGAFGIMYGLLSIESLAAKIPWEWAANLVANLSFSTRYADFLQGMLDLSDIVFFLSIFAVFAFLTVRVFERKRWN